MSRRAKIIDLPPSYVKKLDLSQPAAEQIAAQLRKAILEMSLQPGQIISEAEVGHFFGASRTPIREAFSWLRDQGLIVTYPSRGSFVARLNTAQIKSAQFIRESLEVSVAEYHCEHGLPEDTIDELAENLKTQKSLIGQKLTSAFHELDDNFHRAISDAVVHTGISKIVQREKACLDRLRVLALNSPAHMETLIGDHLDIFEAIRKKDAPEARRAVKLHIRRVLNTLADLVEEHSEFFDE